jgi:branched-chain amino acid transport system permease protein
MKRPQLPSSDTLGRNSSGSKSQSRRTGWLGLYGAILAASIFVPIFLDSYYRHILIVILFWAYLGACWNILGGYAGQFSFGHAAFFGIGAYTSSILFVSFGISPWIGMLLGGIVSTIFGLVVGYLVFRYGLKGPYFALAMLAVAGMLQVICVNWTAVKGALGVLIPLGNSFWIFTFENRLPYYYIILFMLVGILAFTKWFQESRMGNYLVAIREDEDAAEALGVNVQKYKILAMAVSSFTTALGGTFYAQYYNYIDPHLCFGTHVSVDILLRPIVGGPGTVLGPLVGSLLLSPLSELTRNLFRQYSGVHIMIFGALLVSVIIFLPRGVIGLLKDIYDFVNSRFKGR